MGHEVLALSWLAVAGLNLSATKGCLPRHQRQPWRQRDVSVSSRQGRVMQRPEYTA